MGWNLVRDQGVGGSNPLSPTNSFHRFRAELCRKKSITWILPRCSSCLVSINTAAYALGVTYHVYKIDYSAETERQYLSGVLREQTVVSAEGVSVVRAVDFTADDPT